MNRTEFYRLMFPTPRATDADRGGRGDLIQAVRGNPNSHYRMWPTPTAINRPNEGNVRLYRAKVLAGEMTEQEAEALLGKSVWESQGKVPALFPTPTANRWDGLQSHGVNVISGALNPRWIEWLMGYPDGWTDLEDLETP